MPTIGFTFEKDLKASRPYMRALMRDSSCTVTSSVAPSVGWSFFSGVSLADVSCLSAIGLPIVPQDLWNGDRYRVANPSPHNHLEEPWPLLERVQNDMATTTDLNKNSSVSEFGIERKTHIECHKLALFGMVHEISSLQSKVYRHQDADYLGTSLSGKTTICTHLQELYGQGIGDLRCVRICEVILQNLVVAFEKACESVFAEMLFSSNLRLVSILSIF